MNTVLIVDDITENITLLRKMLKQESYAVMAAKSGASALKMISVKTPDLILLDIMMPDMDGFETCAELKKNPDTAEIPVIFISAKDEMDSVLKGFDLGAVDYIVKPFHHQEVLARVNVHLQLQSFIESRDGLIRTLENTIKMRNDFFAGLSHELRTPLNAIIGYSDILQDDFDGETLSDLKKISQAGSYLMKIIDNILDFSKIEADKMPVNVEEVDLPAFMNAIVSNVDCLVKKNANQLHLDHTNLPDQIFTDELRLQQIMLNLLSNACKFTKNGQISIRFLQSESTFQIFVSDTGIGLSTQQIGRLFHPYTQAHDDINKKYGGTGLGLALSKRFCQMLKGDLTVTSQLGQGSTFVVSLPLGHVF